MIDNPEEFMAWMAKVLAPLCDADPGALSKYVYALVKKQKKPTEELKKKLIDQLEVFLNTNTQVFVDQLFEKLKEDPLNDDLPSDVKMIKEEPEDEETGERSVGQSSHDHTSMPSSLSSTEMNIDEELEYLERLPPIQSSRTTDNHPPQVVPAAVVQPLKEDPVAAEEEIEKPRSSSYVSSNGRQSERHASSHSHDRKTDLEREERERSTKEVRRRNSSGSPVRRSERNERSRSRSWDRRMSRRSRSRSRRSRSRGRDRDRSRPFRNKSPPPRTQKPYDRERSRLPRSYSRSPPGRSSRSHTPPAKRPSRYRNRSPFTRSSQSPYESPRNVSASPAHESSQEEDLRSQTLQSVVKKLVRCKDFDEKGFCMRGEMCPYDHGKDPVVLEDLGQVLSSYSAPATMNPVPSGLRLPPPAPSQNLYRAPVHANLAEYNPDAPSMEPRSWAKQPFRTGGRPMVRSQALSMSRVPIYPGNQRELIRVPMEGNEAYYPTPTVNVKKRLHTANYVEDMDTGEPPIKQRFDYNRLGLRPKGHQGGNCSLQLKKIPPGLNNIAHLHNHFVKFGNIVNIQVCFEGDPEAALITFTTNAEASAAYKSTEAVLNNRFIKVFWYNSEPNIKPETLMTVVRTPAKDRLGAPVVNPFMRSEPQASTLRENQENETQKVLFSGANITKTVYRPTHVEKKLVKPDPMKMLITTHNFFATQEANAAKEALKKKEEARREGLKLAQNITNRKHGLLDGLLQQQNSLVEKLEKVQGFPGQKAEIMATLKTLQENIKAIQNDIMADVTSASKPTTSALKVTPQLVKKSKEETTKQILDAELDLFTQQQEGKDVTDLKRRVQELKTKELSLNMLAGNGSMRLPRGGARFRPSSRGRGGFNPHTNVDHRPTKLLVSGFESDDKLEVFEHFSKFGEVVDQVWDEATPALVIQYKTRKDAENAMAQGRNFQDRLLSVTWYNPAQNIGMRSSSMRSVVLLNESELLSGGIEDEDEEVLPAWKRGLPKDKLAEMAEKKKQRDALHQFLDDAYFLQYNVYRLILPYLSSCCLRDVLLYRSNLAPLDDFPGLAFVLELYVEKLKDDVKRRRKITWKEPAADHTLRDANKCHWWALRILAYAANEDGVTRLVELMIGLKMCINRFRKLEYKIRNISKEFPVPLLTLSHLQFLQTVIKVDLWAKQHGVNAWRCFTAKMWPRQEWVDYDFIFTSMDRSTVIVSHNDRRCDTDRTKTYYE